MDKLNKESEVYVVQYYGKALVIHYDNNIHCYSDRKGVQIFTDDTGNLHTLMTESSVFPRREIETIIIDPLLVNYKLKSCYILFAGFRNLKRIIGLEYLNTSEVVNMNKMFFGCKNLTSLDVSSFDTSNVTRMHEMFWGCESLTSLDVSNFNTSNVTDMSGMFFDCYNLKSLDVSKFNTSKVTDMSYMFADCKSLTSLDVSKFNTSKVTDMNHMFDNCKSLTSLDVSNFNTSNVTNMRWMFWGCKSLTSLDVSKFNTSNVTDMKAMFANCANLKTIYAGAGWIIGKDTEGMFENSTKLVGGKGTIFSPAATDASRAKIDGGKANPGYFTHRVIK